MQYRKHQSVPNKNSVIVHLWSEHQLPSKQGFIPVAGLVARATLQFGHHVFQRSAWSPDGKTVGPELD